MREKLAELIADYFGVDPAYFDVDAYEMADHLIANGVTIPVRCGECIHRVKGTWAKCTGRQPYEFCSDGERRFHG